MSAKICISLMLLINYCQCLTLPKIYGDGMVLQGAPSESIIWGYLDEITEIVHLTVECDQRKSMQYKFIPKKVMHFRMTISKC